MRIVARIETMGADRYLFEGKMFESFLHARRAMTESVGARRRERHTRVPRPSLSHSFGA